MDMLKRNLARVFVATSDTLVYKDECIYTYDTPESERGLFVNLTTFLGFNKRYAKRYAEATENNVFLHIMREKVPLTEEEKKPTRLAIGLAGGFKPDTQYKETYYIVVMPYLKEAIPYPSPDMPAIVRQSVESILACDSATNKLKKDCVSGTWDGEAREVSAYAMNLAQLDNDKRIPPYGWKCERCDLTHNLWLNLTDGSILCGRKFFDGSGGNNHAVEHYRVTGFPLAVKLGTISGDGKSDVFSYPEDDMVIDPKLEEHLAHFGINMAAMKKSEKTMIELELEINQRASEWAALTECDSQLQPLIGPGYTGMHNLGNTCYINSVMQVLFTIPDFQQRFVGAAAEKYFDKFPADPVNDFNIQMSKLGNGLFSGKYSRECAGITPTTFKHVIGRSHVDFSTKQQQDAYLFFLYVIEMLDNHSKRQPNPADALKFYLEERVECLTSKKVRYSKRLESSMQLEMPLKKASNYNEVKEHLQQQMASDKKPEDDKNMLRYKISLEACLHRYFAPELVENYFSSTLNIHTNVKKTVRMATMPDYLMMHMRKFTMGKDWSPCKLDVSLQMPEILSIAEWRGLGPRPDEEDLTEPNMHFVYNRLTMSELMSMGYSANAAKRALYNTNNGGLVDATNWIMAHANDEDIDDPFEAPYILIPAAKEQDNFVPDPESLATLIDMGFNSQHASKALKMNDGNIERAADWIFARADTLSLDSSAQNHEARAAANVRDGSATYRLHAFISHMGPSAHSGHYVCHIYKDNRWVIYNDEKVAISQHPPKDLGYMYLYKRLES